MSTKRKEINSSEMKIIIWQWKQGKTLRKIGEMVERSHSSIQGVINSYKKTGNFISKPRSGRPSILNKREKRYVVNLVKKTPKISCTGIVSEVSQQFNKNLHINTIRRIIKNNGYNSRVSRKKPFISVVNRKKDLNLLNNIYTRVLSSGRR